jgi:hypothetical protein
LVIGLVSGLALIHPSPTLAALCIRWQPPSSATANQEVPIAFRTFVPLVSGGYQPWPVPDYPFRFVLAEPGGTTDTLRMRPSDRNPEWWAGSLRPDRAGGWSVQVANFEEGQPSDPACYERLVIRVSHTGIRGDEMEATDSTAWALDDRGVRSRHQSVGGGMEDGTSSPYELTARTTLSAWTR